MHGHTNVKKKSVKWVYMYIHSTVPSLRGPYLSIGIIYFYLVIPVVASGLRGWTTRGNSGRRSAGDR